MSKIGWYRFFSVVLIIGMLVGALTPFRAAAQQPPPPAGPVQPEMPVSPGGKSVQPDSMAKLDSELRTAAEAGGTESIEVYILANAGADLSRVVEVTETRPFPGGTELVVAKVKPAKIHKMASHPDVVAAEAFHAIEAPVPLTPKEDAAKVTKEKIAELRAQAAEVKANPALTKEMKFPGVPASAKAPEATSDWNGAGLIGAPEAWAKGFSGEGVNVAIIDSGVDFGHPDLENNVAFYEDGSYADWPIALDPTSMRSYLYYGDTSWDNYEEDENLSWYAGVYDVLYCTQGVTQTFGFDEFEYSIAADIVDMSKSGEIRWSVHPDIQLPDYVSYYGEWMPFILIDANVAGVYDTVIADLNYDRWIDMYDDTAVLGTTDPVLNQDYGSYIYTDTQVMTGTFYVPNSWWYIPPIWYDGWETTPVSTTLTAGTFILAKNHYSGLDATDGADGIAEVSGGMVYYVSDGVHPVPGMDYLYPASGVANNGQLVAFMLGSDYAGGRDHGTLCSSAAVAAGAIKGYFAATGEFVQYDPDDWSDFFDADDVSEYLPFLKPADEGTVQGPAPGAKIIAIGDNYEVVNGMQGFFDAYTFLAYGVDGEPNSGDEFVDVASMSYGDGSVNNDGWDWESRLLSYYNRNFLPNTAFMGSSGNGGMGFGTVNSPGADTTISVGASTQYGASDVFGSGIAQDQINDGEVQPFSGRGPDALGGTDPDVVATGAWGAGDTPLNKSAIYNFYVGGGWFPGDGNNAWYEWGGTSRSAPEAAGVMATIYQAYDEDTGAFPDFETARQLIMSGAQDLEHDVLMQGAGRVNADTGTDIAGGLGGVYVSPSLLAAGEYKGTQYESFASLLFPGDAWSQTFTVHNPGATAATVALDDEVLMEMDTITYTQVVSPYLGTEGPYPWTYYYSADYLVSADPELAQGYALLRVAHASPDAPPVEVCVDGSVALQDVPFGAVSGYAPLTPEAHQIQVYPANSLCVGTPVISATLPLAEFTDYTVIATDYLDEITPVVLVDNNSRPEEGNAHVRFFHASPDAPAVDVAVVGGPVLFEDIEFQEASDYLPVPGDEFYDLEVRLAGTTTPVLTVPGVYLADGEVYTIFALGEALIVPPTLYALPIQDTPLPDRPVSHGADLAIPLPEGADFMEVELSVPFELFDFCYDDPDPDSVCYSGQHRWSLTVFDWTDRNGDGKLWEDTNDDGVVSYNYGDLIDISATDQVTQTEINRFTYAYNHANVQGATVRLGERDDIDNIVIGLVHNQPNVARGGGPEYYQDNPLVVKVVFYEKVDWPIVAESVASLTVPAGGTATFNANFTIPDDPSLYGLHSGAITLVSGGHKTVIPTTVNVAVPSEELLFTLGGNPASGTPYDNSRMGPGYTWSGVLEEGDWRFYYYDAETGLDQQYLYVDNTWGELCGNMPTFNETLVWGPNPGDQFSLMDPETYGPYGNQFAGGTPYANSSYWPWGNPRPGWWWTNGDDIPQPESRAWATLWDGLNQVQFRNILMSGKHYCGEGYEATAGVFGVGAPEEGLLINTDQESGSFTLDAVSPVDGLYAYSYGFGSEQAWNNQVVPQGQDSDNFPPADLMNGWVYEFDAVNVNAIELTTQGPDSSDIDLYLLFDANNDGFYNPYDNREMLAESDDSGSWEDIYFSGGQGIPFVADGKYAVVMYGYWVMPGDSFDLRMWLYGGEGLTVAGANQDNYYTLDTSAGELGEVTVNWQVDGPGVWSGYLWFGMPWEENSSGWTQGPGIFVPVTINKEGALVDIQKDVDKLMVEWGDILTYTITISNEGSEPADMEVTDVLPAGLELIDEWTDFDGITSTLAAAAPELFGMGDTQVNGDGPPCWMHYDGYKRSVRYGCHLPLEYQGEFYTSDTITFKVRVEAQPGDTFLNKADLKYWPWNSWFNIPYTYLSDTAYSFVPLKVMLPLVLK